MKIHYPKLLRLLQITALLWFILAIAQFVHLNFYVRPLSLFLISLFLFFYEFILESFKNWIFIRSMLKNQLIKLKRSYVVVDQEVGKKSSRLFRFLGRYSLLRLPIVMVFFIISPLILVMKKKIYIKTITFFICGLFILCDIVFGRLTVEWPIIFITLFIIFIIKSYKIPGNIPFLAGIICIALSPFFLIFHKAEMADRSSIWSYILLCIGTVCLLWTSMANKKKKKIIRSVRMVNNIKR